MPKLSRAAFQPDVTGLIVLLKQRARKVEKVPAGKEAEWALGYLDSMLCEILDDVTPMAQSRVMAILRKRIARNLEAIQGGE
jgi:hypothetical protein